MHTEATPRLAWSEALELGLAAMDDTHREFVDLLALCEAASDAELPARWNALVAHTADHFGREDRWMRATGFASTNCHATQHEVVLQVLGQGARCAAAGDLAPARQMARELAGWFPQHAQTMDAALALHLRSCGFDLSTDTMALPDAMPPAAITSCGGACG